MQRLFAFLQEKKHWFILIILQIFSLSLLLGDGFYRQGLSAYISTWFTGHINEWLTIGYSYLHLHDKNDELLKENARLELELVTLRRQISDAQANHTLPMIYPTDSVGLTEGYVSARIINLHNEYKEPYYIINKGEKDGIKKDMPVISNKGVMGAIMEVSENYSIVIPIINTKLKLSCSVKSKKYKGELYSLGHNRPNYFGGVPLHSSIAKGDTLVTSGYSYIFPEGLMVGVIESKDKTLASGASSAFGTFKVKLRTDFEKISHVYVLLVRPQTEAQNLENSIPSYEQ